MSISGRGAKGSIRDRLISLMYRNRYKKFKLNKESYTVSRKEKERQYIIDLSTYQKNGDKDVLPGLEKSVVRNAFISKVGIEESEEKKQKEEVISINTQKSKGVNGESVPTKIEKEEVKTTIKTIKLVGESMSNEVDELDSDKLVDLKKEKKQVDSEITILKEIDKFVNETKPKIVEIKEELDSLKKENINVITVEDSDDLKKRYDKISAKVLKIKNKYQILKEKYGFEDYDILNNLKLMEAITTYKTLATIDELEVMVQVVKEKVDTLSDIKLVEDNSVSTKKVIDDNSLEIQKREEQFFIYDNKFTKVNDIDLFLKEEMEKTQNIIDDLNKRVDKVDKIITIDKIVTGYDKLFSSFLKIAAGIFTIPFNDKKIGKTVLGMGLINKGLEELETSLQVEKKTSVKYIYEDLEENIKKSKDKISDLDNLLIDSSVRIKNIKNYFLNNFIDCTSIPKYEKLRYKVDLLERSIDEKQRQIRVMQGKLDNQLERNKVKIKKVKKDKGV